MGGGLYINDKQDEGDDHEGEPKPVDRQDSQPVGGERQADDADKTGHPAARGREFDQDGLGADAEQDENKVRVDQQLEQVLDEGHGQGLGDHPGGVEGAGTVRHLDRETVQAG